MAKIRLTESQLNQIITESVKNVLSELDWRTYQSAAEKAHKAYDNANDSYEKKRRETQRKNMFNKSQEMYSKQYGLEKFDAEEEKPLRDRKEPTQGELKQASRRGKEMKDFFDGNQEYKNGKWQNKDYASFNM